jgi:hypothetical protein
VSALSFRDLDAPHLEFDFFSSVLLRTLQAPQKLQSRRSLVKPTGHANIQLNQLTRLLSDAFDGLIDAKRILREIRILRHFDHENVIGIRDMLNPPLELPFNDM